nr:transglutaminase domain-containing protein [Mediterraneibacter faecis]
MKNEKYWSKLVIGAICMMAVATVPTRVNAETLPEEKDTIESEMADLQEDIVLESNEVAEAQDDLQTPEESENPETAVESEEPDNLGDSEKPEDVKLEPGWNFIDGKKYYADANGKITTGWVKYENSWYYLQTEKECPETPGAMKTGWFKQNNNWYYLDPARGGKMVASEWMLIDGRWYHFYGGGGMETGWTKQNGNWYHLNANGAMETGWIIMNDDWYYLYPAGNSSVAPEGAMAVNTVINGYVVAPDGVYNEAYQGAYNVLNQVGWNLRAAYNWSANLPYVNYSNDPSPGSKNFAIHGFKTKTGDCYVMAGTFYYMAKLLGYDAHQIAGYVPLRSGNMGVHSWVEIDINGSTYVFDPDFTHESGRNGYQISYGMSGTWRYSNYYRMN